MFSRGKPWIRRLTEILKSNSLAKGTASETGTGIICWLVAALFLDFRVLQASFASDRHGDSADTIVVGVGCATTP
jgi:hypothetical protein